MRSGHTEACVDLCRLAGLPPVGVLAELMNDDGTVMRGPGGRRVRRAPQAQADLHRRPDRLPPGARKAGRAGRRIPGRERDRHAATAMPIVTPFDPVHHMAFVHGRIGDGKNVLARLHRADIIRDVFGGANPVHAALQRFKQEGRGVHRVPARRRRRRADARPFRSRATPARRPRARGNGARSASARRSCKDLGISSIRLLASSQMTYVGPRRLRHRDHRHRDRRRIALLRHFASAIDRARFALASRSARPARTRVKKWPRRTLALLGGAQATEAAWARTSSSPWRWSWPRSRASDLPRPARRSCWRSVAHRTPWRSMSKLALAVDVSYSMDPEEQALQREGYMAGDHLARVHAGAAAGHARQASP